MKKMQQRNYKAVLAVEEVHTFKREKSALGGMIDHLIGNLTYLRFKKKTQVM